MSEETLGLGATTARPSLSFPDSLQEWWSTSNPTVLLATLLLALVIPVCIAVWLAVSNNSSSSKRAKNIVFLGASGSGKTYLFSKLLFGATRPTQTSLAENKARLPYKWEPAAESNPDLPEGAVQMPCPPTLIDTPGHPRLRARALAKNLKGATGAVLLVDGAAGLTAKNIRTTADSLHLLIGLRSYLLSSADEAPFPVLILLTKSDTSPVLLERAKLSLGREMERRRQAASAGLANRIEGLASEGGGTRGNRDLPSDENEILQADIWSEKPWSWDQDLDLGGMQVSWAAANLDQADGARPFYEWMNV